MHRIVFLFVMSVAFSNVSLADNELECLEPKIEDQGVVGPSYGKMMYYGIASVPFVVGVTANTILSKRFPAGDYPFLNAYLNKFMIPVNTALSLPLMAPFGSTMQHYLFWVLQSLQHEEEQKGTSELEDIWRSTQSSYSLNEQMSRNVLNSLTGRVSTNANRAKNAFDKKEIDYAIAQIVDAAVTMRKLFKEVPPDDSLVRFTFRSQVGNQESFPGDLKSRLIEEIALAEGIEWNEPLVKKYYQTLLDAWLATQST